MCPILKSAICFIFSFLVFCSNGLVTSATTRKLSIWGSDNYPPFEYYNKAGEPEGFNVDIIRALMKEEGYEYELKLGDWNKVQQEIIDKNIDVVIGMIYSPERASNVRFTLPMCIINRNIITRKSDHYTSLEELAGKEVIVEKGGWFHRYLLDSNFNVKIIESEDIYKAIESLSSGHYDAVLTSDLVVQYTMKQLRIKNLSVRNLGIEPQNYAIAVNQDRDDLLYRFNIGLQRLKISGEYDRIYNKWFGIYEDRNNLQLFFITLAIFLFIAMLLVVFVWLLRRQVAKATRLLDYSKQEVGIAIDAGRISAWTYTIRDGIIKSLHGASLGGNGMPIQEMYKSIHPEDLQRVRDAFDAIVQATKKRTAVAFRIKEEDEKEYCYVETKMVRVEATKEWPCRIVGTLKNVTDEVTMRKRLEEYRRKSDFIIQTNEIILIQYDIKTQTFSRLMEDENKGVISYSVDDYLAMVYPEDLLIATEFINKLNRAEEFRIDTEFRIITDDGNYSWFIVTGTAYKFDSQGKIVSYMGLRRNNSKWRAINDDLIQLREKAEMSNKLKSAFLANMSHEIRTPLNAIVGFSELIMEIDDKEEQMKFIEIVKTNNELLLRLISDVLDLSRIESGYINFNCEVFDFPEYFDELGISLKIKETKDVEFVRVNRYEHLKINSDRNRISQVITNFVTNAFKFTKRGKITLDCVHENNGIRISVTDTGIGIATEDLSRVFERFVKVNDFAQGTGLGLSICKVIIEALHGSIGVMSQLGAGSTFWFWLPCNVTETGCLPKHPDRMIADSNPIFNLIVEKNTRSSKKTILVAEDVDNNFLIICSVIRDSYNIIRADNGLDAVEKAKQFHPDIILMDIKMPLLGGLDATKEIRKFNATVPIIALTAYIFDTDKQEAIQAGCDEFLTKPVNRSVLMHALENEANNCEHLR